MSMYYNSDKYKWFYYINLVIVILYYINWKNRIEFYKLIWKNKNKKYIDLRIYLHI
jgi:hypothetical protein